MLVVRDREAGNVIEAVDTIAEGNALIAKFEEDDKAEGIYEENFYEVAEIEEKKTERILLKIEPSVKAKAKRAAARDNRTLSGYIVNLIMKDAEE